MLHSDAWYGKGEHQITTSWIDSEDEEEEFECITNRLSITCSNITFIGKGKAAFPVEGEDVTTILGGFDIENKENITFKQMTVTNTSQEGIGICTTDAKVELFDVLFFECGHSGLRVQDNTVVATRCEFSINRHGAFVLGNLTSATFKNCLFHENEDDGIFVGGATVHLHGEATAIHSNESYGILAMDSARVLIHLPSHHNTFYNNGTEDRKTKRQATITNVED